MRKRIQITDNMNKTEDIAVDPMDVKGKREGCEGFLPIHLTN